MEFYRIEYMLKNYEEALDEEEKQYKSKEREYQKQYQAYNPKQMTNTFKSSSSNYGGFKIPKVDVPQITPPKFKI